MFAVKIRISQQIYYGLKKRFLGTTLTEARRLRELEKENASLKRLAAGLTLDRHALQEVIAQIH